MTKLNSRDLELFAGEVGESLMRFSNELDTLMDECKSATELARLYVIARTLREKFQVPDKVAGKTLNMLANSRIPEAMEAEDLRTIAFDELNSRVQVGTRTSCTIIPDQKDAAFQWFRDNGSEDIITETINSSTLAAFARAYMEENLMDMPDDIFKSGAMKYVSVVKI